MSYPIYSSQKGLQCVEEDVYVLLKTADMQMVLLDMQKKTQFLQKKECCAGALEGRLIATLCRLSGAKSVLEVGMFTGTTTLAVAEAIPSDGKVN